MTDSRADPGRFDPRFHPAFQPGYDPANDPSAAARSTSTRFDAAPPTRLTPPDRVAPPRYPEPEESSSVPSPYAPEHRAPDHRPDENRPDETSAADDAVDELFSHADTADDSATGRGVNPFVVILWVVSVVLAAAGITLYRSLPGLEQQGPFSTGDPAGLTFGQVFSLSALAAILIGSGILTAAATLFLLASRWWSRRD